MPDVLFPDEARFVRNETTILSASPQKLGWAGRSDPHRVQLSTTLGGENSARLRGLCRGSHRTSVWSSESMV